MPEPKGFSLDVISTGADGSSCTLDSFFVIPTGVEGSNGIHVSDFDPFGMAEPMPSDRVIRAGILHSLKERGDCLRLWM